MAGFIHPELLEGEIFFGNCTRGPGRFAGNGTTPWDDIGWKTKRKGQRAYHEGRLITATPLDCEESCVRIGVLRPVFVKRSEIVEAFRGSELPDWAK